MGSDTVRASARCGGDAAAAVPVVAGIAAGAGTDCVSACSLICVGRIEAARWNDGDWACMGAAGVGTEAREENDVGFEESARL